MRLIDADELKKKFGYTDEWYKSRTVAHEIDNAPTVETKKLEYKAYNEGFKDGVDQGINLSERPTGKWIRTGSLGNGNAQYECSNCHYGDEQAESQEVPYCWHCGASMRKGGAE